MLAAAGVSEGLLPFIGAIEIAFAIVTIVFWRWRPLFLWNAIAMAAALAAVSFQSPEYLTAAFNPVSLNVAMIVLSAIGFAVSRQIPSAARCLRTPPDRDR